MDSVEKRILKQINEDIRKEGEPLKILQFGYDSLSKSLSKNNHVTCIFEKEIKRKKNLKGLKRNIKDGFYVVPENKFLNEKFDLIIINHPKASQGDKAMFLHHTKKFDLTKSTILITESESKREFVLYKMLCQKMDRYAISFNKGKDSFVIIKP